MDFEIYEKAYKAKCTMLLAEQGELKNYNVLNDYENFKEIIPKEIYNKIIKGKLRRKAKRYRVDNYITKMLKLRNVIDKSIVVFGTLTLKDEILDLKENTYIRKIHNYLKSHYDMVILNKDFGKKNEREHYHYIGLTHEPIEETEKKSRCGIKLYKLQKQDYNLGFEPTIEIVNFEDKKKVRNYLLKLNNHSTKNTTKSRFRVLYNPLIKIFFEYKKEI